MKSYVIVSGAPGSGKSTLAEPLASALGLPLLSKDVIKEQLFDALGQEQGDALAWSKRLGGASMELLWTLAGRFPEAVLEANFRPHSPYERSRILGLEGRVVEVFCTCPPELAKARYAERARTRGHHAVHVLPVLGDELLAEFDGPLGVGSMVEVDTTGPVDVSWVVGEVRSLLSVR